MVICFDKIHFVSQIFVVVGVYRCVMISCKAENYKVFAVFICVCKLVTDEQCVCISSCFNVYNANFNLYAWLCDNKKSSDVVAVWNLTVHVGLLDTYLCDACVVYFVFEFKGTKTKEWGSI